MKLPAVLMIVLMLFHATSAWAVVVYADQCAAGMQAVSEDAHAAHSMPSQDTRHDCCDGMDELACQLHCAGAVPCLTVAVVNARTELRPAAPVVVTTGHRLPPHDRSLLRPPQPLS